jgi:23S rRNA (cytidine1920-2'-O)/16S rRNA (cytidine1409-2'-O)-methyltransferase
MRLRDNRDVRPARVRLDAAVSERTGMTRSQARSLIMEARVRVDGAVSTKAGHPTPIDAAIEIERPRRYVSRGGEKLEAALDRFDLDVRGAELRSTRLATAQRPARDGDGTQ